MQIDLKTVKINPLRQTFVNVSSRIGGDKAASRYQEATLGMQPDVNFHYRPTWDSKFELFDPSRTAIRMKDWYALKDPRQFYYGNWTMTRARQQDAMESNFDFVESRGLDGALSAELKATALSLLVPLRHVSWGANTNNFYICAYGYGTAITAPCSFHAMDHLGIAQYLSRLGLLLNGTDSLDVAKQAWLTLPEWQGLRRYVEDSFVQKDWFALFVAQNFVLDGLLFPLIFDRIVDDHMAMHGGSAIAMLTAFMTEWSEETIKWVDAQVKIAAAESAENRELLSTWTRELRDRVAAALTPIAAIALGDVAQTAVDEVVGQFNARAAKLGLSV